MNSGIIASRYARALLLYTQETGGGERVCAQAARLEQALTQVPELKVLLEDPESVSASRKIEVLETALGGEPMADEMGRFLRLVLQGGRMPLLRLMLHDFIDQWYQSQHILRARLKTVTPPGEAILERIREMVRRRTGCKDVVISTSIDPDLIGGFVFEMEDRTLDASAARELRRIRRHFIENNRRIV